MFKFFLYILQRLECTMVIPKIATAWNADHEDTDITNSSTRIRIVEEEDSLRLVMDAGI